MSETLFATLFLLLISTAAAAAATTPAIGLDSFLSSEALRDPSAVEDSFASIPPTLKRFLAGANFPVSGRAALVSQLLSLQISVPVHVKLVGAGFSADAPSLLQSFVSAAHSSGRFHVVGASSHDIAVSHALHLDSSLSVPLGSRISEAIRSHLDSPPEKLHRTMLSPVPYSVVDRIVQEDFQKEAAISAPAFYIYLLRVGPQTKPYAYSTDSGDALLSYSKCLGTVWTGKDRYLWVDLAAGPVDYGPATSGDGVIPRGEFHPMVSLHGRLKSEKALLADLASMVFSAYQSLLVPSLRIPVHYENSILIQFIHIHGSEFDPTGLDWNSIKQTLQGNDLTFKEQNLVFKSYSVKYSDCSICSFAITRSMNSYTSRFLFENYTMIVNEYLDSKRLHQILTDSMEEMHRELTIPEEGYGKVLPVYVFDLDYDKILLLDRYHQSVAFRDMVIAVRTRTSRTVSDYSCNGGHVITQTRNLDRPIIGSVLQSMWGVSPTHLSWNPQHNTTVVDYTWSIGQTPFGPFSGSSSLSFVQKDAARRNILLTMLNYTVTSALDATQYMAAFGGDKKLFEKNKHDEFVQRWNLFNHKLNKVASAISQLDFEKAMYFLRSLDHDLYAIHTLIYRATEKFDASLVCFKDPPFPWVSASVSGLFIFGFLYIYAKRDKIFRSKRKQF